MVFRDYRVFLKQSKYPLPHRDDMVEFYVWTKAKGLDNNLKLHGFPSDLQYKVKEVVTDYWDFFEDVFCRSILLFLFHIYTGNYQPIC